jgi:carboxynorspermidine decarboxylase
MFDLGQIPSTPAFVYDETRILQTARLLAPLRARGLKFCYSIKALPLLPVLELLAPQVDGFAVSSSFEAQLASMVAGGDRHITSPGLRAEDIDIIGRHCSHVSFNSLNQFRRLHKRLPPGVSCGIRINPELSFAADERFDPCRPYSKLGVGIPALLDAWRDDRELRDCIDGLHFHTVFAATSFAPLRVTLDHLLERLQPMLPAIRWINLGGGYLFDAADALQELAELTDHLVRDYGIQPVFEPGKALVGAAGYLAASVIDRIDQWDKPVAVLDTGVNHHPETFEYQRRPQPAWVEPASGMPVILAGCSCLAGDVFGEYRFARVPEVGDRLAFRDVGAYSLIKANRFNGHDLPDVVSWDGQRLIVVKSFGFADFRELWTADASAASELSWTSG